MILLHRTPLRHEILTYECGSRSDGEPSVVASKTVAATKMWPTSYSYAWNIPGTIFTRRQTQIDAGIDDNIQ